MLSKQLLTLLNNQIKLEGTASMQYLSMATWSEDSGYSGVGSFFYQHAEEERQHMIKLIKYVNGRGEKSIIPSLKESSSEYKDLQDLFSFFLKSEEKVTEHVNEIVSMCLNIKDYITHNFMQWYVAEQMEEENLVINIIDKLKMIGSDKGGLYLFDRDLGGYSTDAGQQ